MSSKAHPELGDLTLIQAVNAGGGAFVSSDGVAFSADPGATGGVAVAANVAVDGTNDQPLYQSQVRSESGFVYSMPVEPGVYVVELHFADLGVPSSGAFDILLENEAALSDFNVAAAAGGANVAHQAEAVVSVEDGALVLSTSPDTGPTSLSGFSVWRADEHVAAATPTGPTPAWTEDGAVAGAFGGGDFDVGYGKLAPQDAETTVIEIGSAGAPPPKNFITAVNAGGDTFVKPDGTVFVADKIGVGQILRTDADIANTGNDALYQSQLWDSSGFVYSMPVEGGTYVIELEFAAIGPNASGGVFDVIVEGETVIDDLDVVAAAGGPNAAVTIEVETEVTDGSLTISASPETAAPSIGGFTVWNTASTLSALEDGEGPSAGGGFGGPAAADFAALGGGGGGGVIADFVATPTGPAATPGGGGPIFSPPSFTPPGGGIITPTGPDPEIPVIPEIDAMSGVAALALLGAVIALMIERRRRA